MLVGKTRGKLKDVSFDIQTANRHGGIFGATGTGKTITLQTIVELLASQGVCCFLVDAKGDLTGMADAAKPSDKLLNIVTERGFSITPRANNVKLWDVFQEHGHPINASIDTFGYTLLANALELNNTQTGVLQIIFRVAEDIGFTINTISNLRYMIAYCIENNEEIYLRYGSISKMSISAIQRSILTLENQQADYFFSASTTDLLDNFIYSEGVVNILQAKKLLEYPRLYSSVMIYILTHIYDNLPERGNADKPLACLFFDEAHLMFTKENKNLIKQVERVIRLIRSKGVGIYFVSQSPSDIPDNILGQTGLRIQHRLSAYTQKQLKAIKVAAETMPKNPKLRDLTGIIGSLGVGEALVSSLDEKGIPKSIELCYIAPPNSFIGEASPDTLKQSTPEKLKIITQKQATVNENDIKNINEETDTIENIYYDSNNKSDRILNWMLKHKIITFFIMCYIIGVIRQ